MKNTIFTGCGTALVTPMNADESVNYERLEQLINSQIENGIDALIICGTTGESSTLEHDEHVKVIEVAAKTANKRVPIIAGTGSNHTSYAVELSQEAVSAGADALLLVTPYYNKTSQQGLISHFTYIADRVDAPIILYNIPSRTGLNIKPETMYELSKHERIVADKEAGGNFSEIAKTVALCGDNLDIYSGNDDQVLPILALGGKGVISVVSNILPGETSAIVKDFLGGDVCKAQQATFKYFGLAEALFFDINPIPVKEAMNMMGLNVGPTRLPLVPMGEGPKEKLRDELKKLGLL